MAKVVIALCSVAATHGAFIAKPRFSSDCGPLKRHLRRRRGAVSHLQNPGAGMNPEALTPYDTVYKDDFTYIDCATDALFYDADKHGDGKFDYTMEDRWNVSIIHYSEMVPSEDQESMTQKVCFDFCRTIPLMGFFGLIHGRDCYCAPFYHNVAGDSSECDLPCTGSAVQSSGMCGGKTKAALFEMHMCANTAQDLNNAMEESQDFYSGAHNLSQAAMSLASSMQLAAASHQAMWGQAGDPVAAELMQGAKVWAGEVEHAAEDLDGNMAEIDSFLTEGSNIKGDKGVDFAKSSTVQAAEAVIAALADSTSVGKELFEKVEKLHAESTRGIGVESRGTQYYPLMYFVDKEFEHVPSTCGGTWDGHTIFGATEEECAAACDAQKVSPECTGYMKADSLCFLFSKFKSVTYYTGCPEGTNTSRCFAKLENYVGTSVAPDASGKCDHCLREATHADRCFG